VGSAQGVGEVFALKSPAAAQSVLVEVAGLSPSERRSAARSWAESSVSGWSGPGVLRRRLRVSSRRMRAG
jgi:hypothetical protein